MKVLLIGNLSDRRCGFQNFTAQMQHALHARGDVELTMYDGTYSAVYALQQLPGRHYDGFFPANLDEFNVVHLVWNAMTMNHYAGAPWSLLEGIVLRSWWDGGPSDASCPFEPHMDVKWSDYPREGYEYMAYPVPDWVDDLPATAPTFTVGCSSVRGDGVASVREVCQKHGWALNLPEPGQWLSIEDEIRRLARSSVNVCWYNTPPLWHNRASAPSMLIAALRPLLINDDPLVAHLQGYTGEQGIYKGSKHGWDYGPNLEECLIALDMLHPTGGLSTPQRPLSDLSWTRAARQFVQTWEAARA